MPNTNEALVYGWSNQQLGNVVGQTGYAVPGNAPAAGTVSTADQVSAGAPSPIAGNVTQILENPGYGISGAAVSPGALTAPALPVSGSGIALNPSGLNSSVTVVTGGAATVTAVSVAPAGSTSFQAIGFTLPVSSSGTFQVPGAGQVKITYTGTPTWSWTAVN